jgi:hypothetical protein
VLGHPVRVDPERAGRPAGLDPVGQRGLPPLVGGTTAVAVRRQARPVERVAALRAVAVELAPEQRPGARLCYAKDQFKIFDAPAHPWCAPCPRIDLFAGYIGACRALRSRIDDQGAHPPICVPAWGSIGAWKLITQSAPLPACVFRDWNPVAASSAESAVAAVLAGFVFSGIIVILSTSPQRRSDAAQALKLLFVAFLGLAITSYLLANDSGEQTCSRADTIVVLAGGPLGAFAVLMLVTITWLVSAYGEQYEDVLRLLQVLIYVAFGFVALLLAASSQYYVSAELGGRHGPSLVSLLSFLIYGVSLVEVLAGLAVITRRRNIFLKVILSAYRRRRPALATAALARRHINHDVDRCFIAALSYAAVAGLGAGVAIGLPRNWYTPVQAPFVYTAGLAALLLPIPLFVLAARALASHDSGNEGAS